MHVLVHQRVGRAGAAGRGARPVRDRARLPQPPWPAGGAHRPPHARAMGKLRADLQHGRPHRLGDPFVGTVGSGVLTLTPVAVSFPTYHARRLEPVTPRSRPVLLTPRGKSSPPDPLSLRERG